jgi:tryptophanyl-tRNA synthetase
LKNDITLSDKPEEIKNKVLSMITDPEKIRLSDPGHPEVCVVFKYHEIFNKKDVANIESDCKKANLGCVACKRRLADMLIKSFQSFRERRDFYERNPQLVWDILMEGSKQARAIAKETLSEVRKAMKIDYA